MDGNLETVGGVCPLVRVEGDSIPKSLLSLPALRAVVPLEWALPADADVDKVADRATRLMQAYEAADRDTPYGTAGGAVAGLFCAGDGVWLAVVPDIGGDPNPFVPEMSWRWSNQVWLGEGTADEQAEAQGCAAQAVGRARDDPACLAGRWQMGADCQGVT